MKCEDEKTMIDASKKISFVFIASYCIPSIYYHAPNATETGYMEKQPKNLRFFIFVTRNNGACIKWQPLDSL